MFKHRRTLERKNRAPLKYFATIAIISALVTVVVTAAGPRPTPSGAITRSAAPFAATTGPLTPATSKGLIAAGPSRRECLEPNFQDTGLASLQAAVDSFDSETHTSVSCISAYLNDAPTWSTWESPWIDSAQYGYTGWVAEQPNRRQLVLAVSLIPASLQDIDDPLSWEQTCADGDFNAYATELGTNLVGAGLGNSVLRLGLEMNGVWEDDFIGTTIVEQKLWAMCFAKEATALRQVTGEHFLIDWNPNACVENIPLANFYPGNAYVDIVGLDLFDVGCISPKTLLTFKQLANEPAGLSNFEAFAKAQGKPMSMPEWGLLPIASDDNPGYVNGIGSTFTKRDFAFETYFDANLKIRAYLPLGPRTPKSVLAFRKWFSHVS
jgi:hypothetical protein